MRRFAISVFAMLAFAPSTLAAGSDSRAGFPPLLPLPRVAPAPPPPAPSYPIVTVKPGRDVALRTAPGGPVAGVVGSSTEFGSPLTLAVVARHGAWLGVVTSDRPNGALAWVDGRSGSLSEGHTAVALVVHLASRRLELTVAGRIVRSFEVGVGRPGSPTPTGRFAVTDKLSGSGYGPYYGCCILALTGHQTATPSGWPGGDRLAIHGTDDPATIGADASAGCIHATDGDLRLLTRRVPLGAPVLIEH